jgi:hypothetical protein
MSNQLRQGFQLVCGEVLIFPQETGICRLLDDDGQHVGRHFVGEGQERIGILAENLRHSADGLFPWKGVATFHLGNKGRTHPTIFANRRSPNFRSAANVVTECHDLRERKEVPGATDYSQFTAAQSPQSPPQ